MRPSRRQVALALALITTAGVAACGSQSRPAEPQPRTTIEIDNQAGLDMNIYVVRSAGARQRLGTATAHARTTFTIPPRLLFGLTPLRFQADPIGGRASPVSQEITVSPGDHIVLRIPPG